MDTQKGNRVIARHLSENDTVTYSIQNVTISPDGGHVGYTLHISRPYSFSIPSRGYIVRRDGDGAEEPRLLAEPIYGPLRWHPSKRQVYALSKSKDGESGIYFWDY